MSEAETSNDGSTQTPRWMRALRSLGERKMLAMLLLSFAAGIPYGAVLGTLNAWLTAEGITPSEIGVLGFIILAYSYKFIWAPGFQKAWFPKVAIPGLAALGPRRAWLMTMQAIIAVLLALLALSQPATAIGYVALIGVLVAFSSATHDIVLEAWRIEIADSDEDKDIMSAVYQFGYRIAGLFTGLFALMLADHIPWSMIYGMIAVGMIIAAAGTLIAPEPDHSRTQVDGRDVRPTFIGQLQHKTASLAVAIVAVGWGVAITTIIWFASVSLTSESPPSAGVFTREFGPLIVILSIILPGIIAGVLLDPVAAPKVLREVGKYSLVALIVWEVFIARAIAGFGWLSAAPHIDWRGIGASLAGALQFAGQHPIKLLVIGAVLAAIFMGARREEKVAGALFHTVLDPLMDLIQRLKWATILILALVLSYRFVDLIWGGFAYLFYLGDPSVMQIVRPELSLGALGHSNTDVAIASKTFGVLMTVAGAAIGGAMLLFIGRLPCLFIGAFLSAITNLLFADLAIGGAGMDAFLGITNLDGALSLMGMDQRLARLTVAIAMENLAGGLASVAFVAFLTSIVNPKFAAVQYALLASLTMLIGSLGRGAMGEYIDHFGFHDFFVLTAWLGGVAVVLTGVEWARQALGSSTADQVAPKPTPAE